MKVLRPRTKVVLSIDPGIKGTGVSIWDYQAWKTDQAFYMFNCVCLRSKHKEWTDACADITQQFTRILKPFLVVKMYVEFPRSFGSAVGIAAMQRGDILKLTYLIGSLRTALPTSMFHEVPVVDWKGQLPKKEVERRCKRIIPESKWVKTDHEWDSIGIGLYLQDKL